MAKAKTPAADRQVSGGIELPVPKTLRMSALEVANRWSEANVENLARAGRNTFVSAIEREIKDRGYRPEAGPRPCAEEGMKSFLDGNGRMSVLARLAKTLPDVWGKVEVDIDVYPSLTDEQRQEIINRASRATAPFTEADYYKRSMDTWIAHPDDTYLEHLQRVGLEFAMLFFTPAPEECLIRDTNGGVKLRDNLKDDDLWGKGKKGQKQGPVQVGNYLAQAHPRARKAFFDSFGADKEHAITYRELIDTVKEWKNDKKLRPDLANPPADFEVLVKDFPQAELVNGVLGKRIVHGREVQGGRDAGKGRMSAKDIEMFSNSLNFSKCGPILLESVERTAGYQGDAHNRALIRMFQAIEDCMTSDLSTPEGVAKAQAAQKVYKDEYTAIYRRAASEAEAQRAALLVAETKGQK